MNIRENRMNRMNRMKLDILNGVGVFMESGK